MGVRIEQLSSQDIEEYNTVIRMSNHGMRWHTLKWRKVLQRFTETMPIYLVAKLNGNIVGVLPSFLKKNAKYGNVINSLPFFGTHGGPVVKSTIENQLQIKRRLLLAFKDLAKENDCISSTLITTPFENSSNFIQETLKPDFTDSRITQITTFHKTDNIEKTIMNTVEKRCRNAIRKAQKSGIEVKFAEDMRYTKTLFEMHKEGMEKKAGIVKPWRFFEILFEEFPMGQSSNVKILFAWKNNEIIAGLLLTYYKNIVDYFTPVFKAEYSSLQPNTLLIFEAMKDSLRNNYNIWNFGGGGDRLSGVYKFKQSWGTKDYPYYYFTNIYREINDLQNLRQEDISSEYRWFYVFPFTQLRRKGMGRKTHPRKHRYIKKDVHKCKECDDVFQ